MTTRTEVATLGGGCFWCLEAVFRDFKGVRRVEPGYAGGHVPSPSYELVCLGITGHAEVVQIEFEPDVITFRELLEVFFTIHDPTTPNRQGPDIGTQYRSVIFCHSSEQQQTAAAVVAEIEAVQLWDRPLATEIMPLTAFYAAEQYHRDYYARNPSQPYCRAIVAPKVAKARGAFLAKLKQ